MTHYSLYGVKKKSNIKLSILALVLAFAMTAVMSMLSTASAAHIATVVKSANLETETDRFIAAENDSGKWFYYNDETDTIDNSLGSFVTGPDTPPAGDGSAQISVTGTERVNLATYRFSNTVLSDITELKYSTYNASATNGGTSTSRSGYLQFNVDFNGLDTWQKRLTFLPSDNNTVTPDQWQEWDAINNGDALWRYSGATWPGTAISGSTPRTWSDILDSYPGVSIRDTDAFLGIRVGEPYPDGYTENLDKFVWSTTSEALIFDFEANSASAITSPLTGEEVTEGDALVLSANDDGAYAGGVNWAVRTGSTCAANTGTVAGNVDGHSDTFTWQDGQFNATVDTTGFAPGEYCFVFNPTQGQRLTRMFTIVEAASSNPGTKDDCKNGGYEAFGFKNQGQCIQFVNTGKDARNR